MTLERRTEIDETARLAALTDVGASNPDAAMMRDQGLTLLDAADEAINRALSRNSGQFLAQGRQTGGQ